MPDLELARIPNDVARLLMARGSDLPPLQWHQHQNSLAKRTLEQIADANLLNGLEIKDARMVGPIRGLLYLWTGWPQEAVQQVQSAEAREQAYLTGLAERHQARSQAAKDAFRKIDDHPVFAPLGEYVLQTIRPDSEGGLRRFRDIVAQGKNWEPFAFIDLFEQARLGNLAGNADDLVRRIQVREFELLLNFYFQAGTGITILKKRALSEAEEKRREEEYRKRMLEKRREREQRAKQSNRLKSEPPTRKPPEPAKKAPPPPPDPRVKVLCPACGHLLYIAESNRGKPAQCLKCQALFRVPDKKPAPALAGAGKPGTAPPRRPR